MIEKETQTPQCNASSKKYHTIAEAAQTLSVNVSKIRFWEKQMGGLLRPQRNEAGSRRYTHADLDKLREVNALVQKGYTLKGVKQAMTRRISAPARRQHVLEGLKEIKYFLTTMKHSLEQTS